MMEDAAFASLGLRAPAWRVDPPVGPRDIATLLDPVVAATPDAEALADTTRRYTFAALDAAVDGAARLLASRGIAAGTRVAGSLPNGCDLVIAFLAVQRLGAVWVGINRVLSPAEKAHILHHSGTRLLVTDTAGAGDVGARDATMPEVEDVLVVDEGEGRARWTAALAEPRAGALDRPAIDPYAPAAIAYTSGTTGIPKGVVHSQHNMVTVCAASSDAGLQRPAARRGVILPMTIVNTMVLGPLFAFWNGQACICGHTGKPAALAEWLVRERIGVCSSVPTIVYDLLQSDCDLPAGLEMRAGGAPLPAPVRLGFLRRHGSPIGGSYGLTEALTMVTETRGIEPPAGSSGLALPHIDLTIRDAEGALVPAGETGEICVTAVTEGPWARVYLPALGYWRDAARTAALLRGGVLHSGDMGRLDEQGWLYVADRSSELILRAGSNIYPGEIERVLYEHGAVAGCAVVGLPDERLGMRTVAVVQPVAGAPPADQLRTELAALCRGGLARYKMPDQWAFVEAFPRNAMGKIVKPKLLERLAAMGTG